jgi:hypothetical protein
VDGFRVGHHVAGDDEENIDAALADRAEDGLRHAVIELVGSVRDNH